MTPLISTSARLPRKTIDPQSLKRSPDSDAGKSSSQGMVDAQGVRVITLR